MLANYFVNYLQRYGLWFMVGAFVALRILLQTEYLPEPLSAEIAHQKSHWAAGWVSSIPKKSSRSVRFVLAANRLDGHQFLHGFNLSWYGKFPVLHAGDYWRLPVKLKPAHSSHNPGGGNYLHWLLSHNIVATGYVKNKPPAQKLKENDDFYLTRVRQFIADQIRSSIHDAQLASIIIALTVGSRVNMSAQVWQVFQNTGTSHLVAISGLHIGLMAGAGFWLLSWLAKCFPRLLLYYPASYFGRFGALVLASIYALLAGLAIPTQRALIMLLVFIAAEFLHREVSVWKRLFLALLIILAIDPSAWSTASFWLSFCAVSMIAYSLLGRKKSGKWWQFTVMQTAIFIGLIPITLWFFHQVSWLVMPANALAIPWFSFFVAPLSLFGVLVLLFSHQAAHGIFWLSAHTLWPMWWLLSHAAFWPHVVWQKSIASLMVLFCALYGVLLLFAPRGTPHRWLGVVFCLPLFFYQSPAPQKSQVWMTMLDVGQGLAVLVRTAHHTLLYDTGPAYVDGFDAGAAVIVPFLRYRGINQIDSMMISHGDNDHIGGAMAVLKHVEVNDIKTSVPDRFKHQSVGHCVAGDHWRWDGVDFRVLWPIKGMRYSGNNSSCVLLVDNGQQRLLLTGDIEAKAEAALLSSDAFRQHMPVDVVTAPHHGSLSSSTVAFVKALKPHYVLYSTGFYNKFHFPNKVVMSRYQAVGAQSFDTAFNGAIIVKADQKNGLQLLPTKGYNTHR